MTKRTADELEEDRRLILAAQHDRAAFSALYERYVDQIFAYCLNLTKNRELALDVTAATFARAFEDLPRFQWRGVPYSAWLYRVAANLVARDRRRAGWVELGPALADTAPDPADTAVLNTRDEELRSAIATLASDQREVVLLRFNGGLRNKEIAEIMGRSEGAVKLLTFRALTNLRKVLGAPQPSERDQRNGDTIDD